MASSITEAFNITTYRAGSNAPDGSKSRIRGALPLPTYTANSPSSVVAWSDNGAGGTFLISGANSQTLIYQPANKTQIITIQATDSTGATIKQLTVFATLPIQPQVGIEKEIDRETKIKLAKDRTRYSRTEGEKEIGWQFGFEAREKNQEQELMDFWDHHEKIMPFWMIDTEGNVMNKVFFTSSFKSIFTGANRWAMAMSVKGVYQRLAATAGMPLHLRINCGGFALNNYAQDNYFGNGQSFSYTDPDNPSPNPTIITTGLTDAAVDEIYRWIRYDPIYVYYTFPYLRPTHNYKVRLHFAANQRRVVRPAFNQVPFYPDIEILAGYIAKIVEYNVVADLFGNLQILIARIEGVNAIINAIEVIEL